MPSRLSRIYRRSMRLLGVESSPYGHVNSPFFRLPLELRFQIYDLVLDPYELPVYLASWKAPRHESVCLIKPANVVELLRVCKIVHKEARQILAERRQLRIQLGNALHTILIQVTLRSPFRRSPNPWDRGADIIQDFRHLRIAIEFWEPPPRDFPTTDHYVVGGFELQWLCCVLQRDENFTRRSASLHINLACHWMRRAWWWHDITYKYDQLLRVLRHFLTERCNTVAKGLPYQLEIHLTDLWKNKYRIEIPNHGPGPETFIRIKPHLGYKLGEMPMTKIHNTTIGFLSAIFGESSKFGEYPQGEGGRKLRGPESKSFTADNMSEIVLTWRALKRRLELT